MSRSAHSMKFQISTLLFSTVLSMLSVPALARTGTVSCPEAIINGALKNVEPQDSNAIQVQGTCRESVGTSDFANLTAVAGLAAAPQLATVRATNRPNTYTGN